MTTWKGRTWDCSLAGLLHFRHALPQPAVLFRRTAFERCGGFDETLDLAMDVDLWLKLARAGEAIALPSDVLARFRLHADAKSVRRAAAAAREDFAIRRRNGMRLLSPAGLDLLRYGYAYPVLAPGWRLVKPMIKRLLGEQQHA